MMSQTRVTDFFSQRRSGNRAAVKEATKQHSGSSTRSRSLKSQEASILSSTVHEEFVRVIDEAVGVNNETSTLNNDLKHASSQRTPKRCSTEFDFAAEGTSAAAQHSTAKKRRQTVIKSDFTADTASESGKRRRARKKLMLPPPSPQAQPLSIKSDCVDTTTSVVINKESIGQAKKTLSKEDIATLKSRLQRIKKSEDKTSTASVSTSTTVSSSSSSSLSMAYSLTSDKYLIPHEAASPITDATALTDTLARAKQLAAEAQRRDEKVAKESVQSEIQSQDSVECPAYQRYHTIAQAVPPGLYLPYQYKVLAEMFRNMDTVVAMLYNRCETATFARVKKGVQDMLKKRIEDNHLGQIKTVFPECYSLRQEKNIPAFNSSTKKGTYQLTIEPIIPSDQSESRPLMTASRMLERRRVFHGSLVTIVKQHHKEFLESLFPPVTVPDDKLTRWHPHFLIDTVPAIPVTPLPQPPHTEKLFTAQEVLDKARSLITPKMERALVSLTLKSEEKNEEAKDSATLKNPFESNTPALTTSSVPAALKGVPLSLLERIRAKEVQKLQASMMRNPVQEERLLMLSRLGELSRILRTVFIAEKKPALIMEVACNRMMASFRSTLSAGEMEKHLRLLAEVAGDWLTIHPIRKDSYLKLNKNMEMSSVLEKLNKRLKDEEIL